MSKFGPLILAAALMACPAIAQATDDQAEIIRLEDAWRQARVERDTAFLDRFYAADMRIRWLDGTVISRSEGLDRFRDGTSRTDFIRHGPLQVSVAGDMAIVTGVDHVGGTLAGEYGEMHVRFIDVLVKREGRWQLLLQQATRTQDPA